MREIEDITDSYSVKVNRVKNVLTELINVHKRIGLFAAALEKLTGNSGMTKDVEKISFAITDIAESIDGISDDMKEVIAAHVQGLTELAGEVEKIKEQMVSEKK